METDNHILLFVLYFFFCGITCALTIISAVIYVLVYACVRATIVLPSLPGHLFQTVPFTVCHEPVLGNTTVCDGHQCYIYSIVGEIRCENSYTDILVGNTESAFTEVIIVYCIVVRPVVRTAFGRFVLVLMLMIYYVKAYIDCPRHELVARSGKSFTEFAEQDIGSHVYKCGGVVTIMVVMVIYSAISAILIRAYFVLLFALLFIFHMATIGTSTIKLLLCVYFLLRPYIMTNHPEMTTICGTIIGLELDYTRMGITRTLDFMWFKFKEIQKHPHSGIVAWMSMLLVMLPKDIEMCQFLLLFTNVVFIILSAMFICLAVISLLTIIPVTAAFDMLWLLLVYTDSTMARHLRQFVVGSVRLSTMHSFINAGTSRCGFRSVHNRSMTVRMAAGNTRPASRIIAVLDAVIENIKTFFTSTPDIILVGSVASGTRIYFQSDIDFMVIPKNLVIEESKLIYNQDLPSYLRIPRDAVNVGTCSDLHHSVLSGNGTYVRADPIRNFDWRLFGLARLSVLFARCSRVGRTTGGVVQILLGGPYDYVPQLRLSTFPSVAQTFISRPRYWPPNNVIASIIDTCDFHVTARACPINPNKEYDFCLSFALAEVRIADAMSPKQKKCLIKLKRLKALLNGDSDTLTSYHIKTVALWFFEELKMTAFEGGNIDKPIIMMLSKLRMYLRSGHLPHYFVPKTNLFAGIPRSELSDISKGITELTGFP